jgi:hypothetical protein
MTIALTQSVPANSRTTNVLAGQQFEFLPAKSLVQVGATSSATGINADFNIGGETLIVDALIPPTNRYPFPPDDIIATSSGRAGERLFLTFRNTTAGALTVQTKLEITPI